MSATDGDPIEPLGYRGLIFFYRRVSDDSVLELHARDHTAAGLLGLTAGEMSFYFDTWGDENDDAIDWESVASYLMGSCLRRGEYQVPRTAADLA